MVLAGTRSCTKGELHTTYRVAFSPNGQILASASRDNIVKLWDLIKGMSRGALRDYSPLIEAVASAPDG